MAERSTAKKVLVFGSSGMGKTSFVNALTGENMPTSDGSRGETFKSQGVSVRHEGVDYCIMDTVGLNEANKGAVSGKDAAEQLVQLLQRLVGGINLMVMVMQKGRIHSATLDNYKLFVETMTARAVPLVIVVTHCERTCGKDMQGWVNANRLDFLTRGIKAEAIVGGTFLTPDPEIDNVEVMNERVRRSADLSWVAIRACATDEPVDFIKLNGGFMPMFRKVYNSIASWFTWLFGNRAMWVRRDFVTLIQRAGNMSLEDARQFAKETVANNNHVGN